MDHDCLSVPRPRTWEVKPLNAMVSMIRDEWCLVRHERGGISSIDTLRSIYRVNEGVVSQGSRVFEAALDHGYGKTQEAIAGPGPVRSLFSERYLSGLAEWKRLICAFLREREKNPEFEVWERPPEPLLQGFSGGQILRWVDSIRRGAELLERYKFLYLSR